MRATQACVLCLSGFHRGLFICSSKIGDPSSVLHNYNRQFLGREGGGIAHDARRERRQLCGFRNLADGSFDVDHERARCFYNFNYEIWEKFVLRWHALHLRRGTFLYSLSQVRGIASVQPRHKGGSVAIAARL